MTWPTWTQQEILHSSGIRLTTPIHNTPHHPMPCKVFLQHCLSHIKQKILPGGDCRGQTSSCFLPLRRVTKAILLYGSHSVEGHQGYSSSCLLSLWMVPSLTPYLCFLFPGRVPGPLPCMFPVTGKGHENVLVHISCFWGVSGTDPLLEGFAMIPPLSVFSDSSSKCPLYPLMIVLATLIKWHQTIIFGPHHCILSLYDSCKMINISDHFNPKPGSLYYM